MVKFEHSHHDHGHQLHDNSIDSPEVNRDEEKLAVLLNHWIEHNKSHQDSFEQWAQKALAMNKQDVSDYIKKAVEYMDKANEMLVEAKKSM